MLSLKLWPDSPFVSYCVLSLYSGCLVKRWHFSLTGFMASFAPWEISRISVSRRRFQWNQTVRNCRHISWIMWFRLSVSGLTQICIHGRKLGVPWLKCDLCVTIISESIGTKWMGVWVMATMPFIFLQVSILRSAVLPADPRLRTPDLR